MYRGFTRQKMASLVWHKNDDTRTVLARLTDDEMEAARVPHGFNGIDRLKSDMLRHYLEDGKIIACVGDMPQDMKGICIFGTWADIWETVPDEKSGINQQLTAKYYWKSDDEPDRPHWHFL